MLQTRMTLFAQLSNEALLAEASRLASCERHATAALIRCLMEVDTRRLYLAPGYPSLFTFCTQVLHLSEHAALGRIEVARAARRLPAVLAHLEDGSVTATNARMLAPHMNEANCGELLAAARHRSKREVEEIVARLRPQPDVASAVRKLPSTRMVASPASDSRPITAASPATAPQMPPIADAASGRAAAVDKADRRSARARAIQDPVHRIERDAPEVAVRAGHAPTRLPDRRRFPRFRPCAVRSDRAVGEAEVWRYVAPSRIAC